MKVVCAQTDQQLANSCEFHFVGLKRRYCNAPLSTNMQKNYLMAILLATMAIPMMQAKHAQFQKGMRKTVLHMTIFILAWGLGCVYVYWSLPK